MAPLSNQGLGLVQGVLGGVTALGSAIYGGIKSGKYNRKAEQLIQKQRDDNREWYNIASSRDYTQRSDVQAAIKKQRELLNEQYERAKASGVVAGGTDEALALQKAAANQSLAQTATDVAARASDYKDNVERQFRQQDAALNQQQAADYRQIAANTAQAASQAVNAGLNMVGQGVRSYMSGYPTELKPGDPGYEGWLKQQS